MILFYHVYLQKKHLEQDERQKKKGKASRTSKDTSQGYMKRNYILALY